MSVQPISLESAQILQIELTEKCQQLKEQIRKIELILERLQESGLIYLPPSNNPPPGMFS